MEDALCPPLAGKSIDSGYGVDCCILRQWSKGKRARKMRIGTRVTILLSGSTVPFWDWRTQVTGEFSVQ
jgi:hypothetical protein